MKTVNLLPRTVLKRAELKGYLLKYAAFLAAIFLLASVIILVLDRSIVSVRARIQDCELRLQDPRFENADALAEAARVVSLGEGVMPDGFVLPEKVSLDVLAMIIDTVLATKTDGKQLYIEDMEATGKRAISLAGIASERGLISDFVRNMLGSGVFSDIDAPQVIPVGNGLYKFSLSLTVAEVGNESE